MWNTQEKTQKRRDFIFQGSNEKYGNLLQQYTKEPSIVKQYSFVVHCIKLYYI